MERLILGKKLNEENPEFSGGLKKDYKEMTARYLNEVSDYRPSLQQLALGNRLHET